MLTRADDAHLPAIDEAAVARAAHDLLVALGQDVTGESLQDTPRRVGATYAELLRPRSPGQASRLQRSRSAVVQARPADTRCSGCPRTSTRWLWDRHGAGPQGPCGRVGRRGRQHPANRARAHKPAPRTGSPVLIAGAALSCSDGPSSAGRFRQGGPGRPPSAQPWAGAGEVTVHRQRRPARPQSRRTGRVRHRGERPTVASIRDDSSSEAVHQPDRMEGGRAAPGPRAAVWAGLARSALLTFC